MKILVIEDQDYKYSEVEGYLKQITEFEITRKAFINDALMEIMTARNEEKNYDMIVLDMQLPRYSDEPYRINPNAGEEILREIERLGINTPVVICSGNDITEGVKTSNVIDTIKYDSSVYLLPQFTAAVKRVEDIKPEKTYITIYYSFDASAIKEFSTRKQALDYMTADLKDETRIQTEENGKVLDVDFKVINEVEDGEYAKMTFINGDVIEWSIPQIL